MGRSLEDRLWKSVEAPWESMLRNARHFVGELENFGWIMKVKRGCKKTGKGKKKMKDE